MEAMSPYRRRQAQARCLICTEPMSMMFPRSANCNKCGAIYVAVGKAKRSVNDFNMSVVQTVKITGKHPETGAPLSVEQAITWDL